ncbi:MAG: metalloregulator ArsR/SmtB family transcription factor [Myxococcales bacterium]|nr:metalloregulator ArsR/SmtB family transcription factor [Myxococcales bacterium]
MEQLLGDLATFTEIARVRLLSALMQHELGVGELCRVLQLPQSTVSRHLKALQVAGFVRRRSEGTSGLYRADPDELDDQRKALWGLVHDAYLATLQAEEDRVRLQSVLQQRDGQGFFERRHAEWDAMRRELFGDRFLSEALLALLPPDLRIADLGCGTGPALVVLAPVVRRVIGVDREQKMLRAAEGRVGELDNVDLRLGGIEDPPLSDGEVDAAICVLVLHHVADLDAAFVGARRVLVPHGRLVVVDMMAHDRRDWLHTMGHAHLGFDRESLQLPARRAGLVERTWRPLPPSPEVSGPPLFLAVYERA